MKINSDRRKFMKLTGDFVIQISTEADVAVCHAAEKLQFYLSRIFGFTLDIRTDHNDYFLRIAVGRVKSPLIEEIELSSLSEDGCAYRIADNQIQIAGRSPRGTVYGVFTFLENVFGCRYFVKDDFYIPSLSEFEISEGEFFYSPPFVQRDYCDGSCQDSEFGMANRLNGNYYRLEEKHGGYFEIPGFCHTLPEYIGVDEYYAAHPEYFALVGGKRLNKRHAQLCFTNPELVPIAVQKILHAKREYPNCNIFSLSQGDGYYFCECENCQKLYREQESFAAPMILFVNAVARAVRREYPDVVIDTIAYLHTRRPPKSIRLEDNVQIRHCSIECCQLSPLGECGFREERCYEPGKSYPPEEFSAEAKKWGELTERLFAWDYPVNVKYAYIPYPNLKLIQPNLKKHLANGVKGVFENALFTTNYSSYSQLRGYLYAKCLWDPDCDMDRHRNEFMDFYYGEAGGKMKEVLTFLEDRLEKIPLHAHCGYPFGRYAEQEGYFAKGFAEEYDRLLSEAEKMVLPNSKFADRIRRERLSALLVKLLYLPDDGERFEGMLDEFFRKSKELDVGNFCEAGLSEKEVRYMLKSKDFLFERG